MNKTKTKRKVIADCCSIRTYIQKMASRSSIIAAGLLFAFLACCSYCITYFQEQLVCSLASLAPTVVVAVVVIQDGSNLNYIVLGLVFLRCQCNTRSKCIFLRAKVANLYQE